MIQKLKPLKLVLYICNLSNIFEIRDSTVIFRVVVFGQDLRYLKKVSNWKFTLTLKCNFLHDSYEHAGTIIHASTIHPYNIMIFNNDKYFLYIIFLMDTRVLCRKLYLKRDGRIKSFNSRLEHCCFICLKNIFVYETTNALNAAFVPVFLERHRVCIHMMQTGVSLKWLALHKILYLIPLPSFPFSFFLWSWGFCLVYLITIAIILNVAIDNFPDSD